MKSNNDNLLKIGICSWNYDSWVGLVYSKKQKTAAEYLKEYSQKYDIAEIDSWFYKIPEQTEVFSYLENARPDFPFTCKIPKKICLTHKRNYGKNKSLEVNDEFLSGEIFDNFLKRIEPMLPQIEVLMMEFEYLNKEKMGSQNKFMERVGDFIRNHGKGLPIGIECRNTNYLNKQYFEFIEQEKVIHVFSEKQHLPHVYDLYEEYKMHIKGKSVIRLLGGDRKEIEKKTSNEWNKIVDEKRDKDKISRMTKDIKMNGNKVIINVNNNFEGSAPITIESLKVLLKY